jgi:2-phosphosulfolactate phosphatase
VNTSDRVVKIDFLPSAAAGYGPGWAVVGVDIFRATTVVCTASASSRTTLVAADVMEAVRLADQFSGGALLAGEQGGYPPAGFDVGNSPAEVERRTDVERPLVLVTSSGTRLLRQACSAAAVFAACLRNVSAQVEHLLGLDLNVAVIGAGTRGERRQEDDLGCARIAAGLVAAGYAADSATRDVIDLLAHAPVDWCASGSSAAFLRRVGRQEDIDFVLSHVDDLAIVCEVRETNVLSLARTGAYAF